MLSLGCRGGAGLDPREAQSIYLGEFLSSSRLVVIVPVACWVRPVPR